jgi:hypothetical protein
VIGSGDTIRLAPGVTVREARLDDPVRRESWPLNATAAFVLERTGRPLGETVADFADAFSLTYERSREDVLRFVWQLNGLALVNVERRGSRLRRLRDWLALAARLAPAGAFPAAVTRRRALDTRSVWRALVTCLVAISARAAAVAVAATALLAQFAMTSGVSGLVAAALVGACTGLGLGLHEAAHAALLRGVPSALVTRGRRTAVLHAAVAPDRRVVVAVGGPLVVALLGAIAVGAGALTALPLLVVAGCPLAAHALALTVAGGDGRVACGL